LMSPWAVKGPETEKGGASLGNIWNSGGGVTGIWGLKGRGMLVAMLGMSMRVVFVE
jgi:hypothetical protein